MSSKLPIPPPGFDDLSPDEQSEYVQELCDYIDSRSHQIDIPEWHRQILEERLAQYGPDFTEGTTWEEFEKELLEQLVKE